MYNHTRKKATPSAFFHFSPQHATSMPSLLSPSTSPSTLTFTALLADCCVLPTVINGLPLPPSSSSSSSSLSLSLSSSSFFSSLSLSLLSSLLLSSLLSQPPPTLLPMTPMILAVCHRHGHRHHHHKLIVEL